MLKSAEIPRNEEDDDVHAREVNRSIDKVRGEGLSEISVSEGGKSRMNMLDLAVQARDLKNSLLGMRLSNIYDFDSRTLVFKLGGSSQWHDRVGGGIDSQQESMDPMQARVNSTNGDEGEEYEKEKDEASEHAGSLLPLPRASASTSIPI